MMFKQDAPLYSYEVVRESGKNVMYVNYLGANFVPSLIDSAEVMGRTIDALREESNISRIVFVQQRNYSHSFEQVKMLNEVGGLYDFFVKQERVVSPEKLSHLGTEYYDVYAFLNRVINEIFVSDPVWAYRELKGALFTQKAKDKGSDYVRILERIVGFFDELEVIRKLKEFFDSYPAGDRGIYSEVFRADIMPNFTFTRMVAQIPDDAEIVKQYSIAKGHDKSLVTIFKRPDKAKLVYHLSPPEYLLDEDHHMLLNLARNVLIEHRPTTEEFNDPERIRQVFFNVARDLLSDLAENKNVGLSHGDLVKLANILVRYTIGFGILEVLLEDENLQDIMVNAPVSLSPVFVRHNEFDECVTNLIPSREDADSWAAKFRMISGRALDEANPILDTNLELGNVSARVAIIQNPLSAGGLAYTLRRHRSKPWTLPLFIKNKMIDSLGAGLLSFMVDGARTLLVAGTRSSGKTSLLGSLLLEIMPSHRIITVEDTLEIPISAMRKLDYDILSMKVRSALAGESTEVAAEEGIRSSLRLGDSSLIVGEIRSSLRGNEEVVIVEKGVMKRVMIKDMEGKNLKDIYVPTIGFDLKNNLTKLDGLIKHPRRKKMLRIITKTGREVTVTPDHSLFAPTMDFKIAPKECKDLKIGSQIIIPSKISCGFKDIDSINVFDYCEGFRVGGFEDYVRKAIKVLGWKKATKLCEIKCGDIYNYFRRNQKTNIPFKYFKCLMDEAKIDFKIDDLSIKRGTSLCIPAKIPVDEDFCKFLGYYVSEGYYSLKDKIGGGVVITNSNEEIQKDIHRISKKLFDLIPKKRIVKGLGTSVQHQLHCLPLAKLISNLGCGRTCYEKRVPEIIYGLSRKKIAAFLNGLFSGDGSFTYSESGGNSVRYFSTSKKLVEDVMYLLLVFGIVGRFKEIKRDKENRSIGYIIEFKDKWMIDIFFKEIGFLRKVKDKIYKGEPRSNFNLVRFDKDILREHISKYPRKYRHLFRFLRCGKNYLRKMLEDDEVKASERIRVFANGEFYIDEVRKIEEIKLDKGEYVYDFTVKPMENFVGGFGGILLHNSEAKALYEAMRVGALANVVAGTIHGGSPYAVFDRVVNDLGVPITSFKATDLIVVCNPIKTADGLHSWRRVLEIAEVRKHWEKDPLKEGGFVDLMKYDVKKDMIKPTDDLINGDSEIMKDIASNVKGWAGDWDAVWDNVVLRQKIKQEVVDYSEKIGKLELLEGEFTVKSNNAFHQISDEVTEEIGLPTSDRVFLEWKKWLERELKRLDL